MRDFWFLRVRMWLGRDRALGRGAAILPPD